MAWTSEQVLALAPDTSSASSDPCARDYREWGGPNSDLPL